MTLPLAKASASGVNGSDADQSPDAPGYTYGYGCVSNPVPCKCMCTCMPSDVLDRRGEADGIASSRSLTVGAWIRKPSPPSPVSDASRVGPAEFGFPAPSDAEYSSRSASSSAYRLSLSIHPFHSCFSLLSHSCHSFRSRFCSSLLSHLAFSHHFLSCFSKSLLLFSPISQPSLITVVLRAPRAPSAGVYAPSPTKKSRSAVRTTSYIRLYNFR